METFPKLSNNPTETDEVAGHCYRNPELVASELVLRQPNYGRKKRRRQRTTFVDISLKDTGLKTVYEVANYIGNRDVWQAMSTRVRQR